MMNMINNTVMKKFNLYILSQYHMAGKVYQLGTFCAWTDPNFPKWRI